jgi:hypothetical protein
MGSIRFLVLVLLVATPAAGAAQAHEHTPGMQHPKPDLAPSQPGQAAFAAIAEVVAILSADSTTDWTRVDLEALRRHLIDMDDVVMRATALATPVPGGVRLAVEGRGSVEAAIRRMVVAHAGALDGLPEYRAEGTPAPGGAVLVVRAEDPTDARAVARIRGLGFVGLLAEGSHHAVHHLEIARGGNPHAGHH